MAWWDWWDWWRRPSVQTTPIEQPAAIGDPLARIRDLQWKALVALEGALAGRHLSPRRGRSVSFAEHRPYVVGDDVRSVDWRVWGRSDRYVVKKFHEESNLQAWLLLDGSGSMAYGADDTAKHRFAAVLGACLAHLLLRQTDTVGLLRYTDRLEMLAPARGGMKHWPVLLRGLATLPSVGKAADFPRVCRQLCDTVTRRSLVVVLGDVLSHPLAPPAPLRLLQRRGHDVMMLHVLHPDEIRPPFDREVEFTDLEGAGRWLCDPRRLRAEHEANMTSWLAATRRECMRAGVTYRLARTDTSAAAVLLDLLQPRRRRMDGGKTPSTSD